MTQDKFLAAYGDTEVTFCSYYKYTFSFRGAVGETGSVLTVWLGGISDDIYRLHITSQACRVADLPFLTGAALDGHILVTDD